MQKISRLLILTVFIISLSACGISDKSSTANNPAGSVTEKKNEYIVSLSVKNNGEEKSYQETVEAGASVIDLMQIIQDQGKMKFIKKDSTVGAFVEEINGVPNNPEKMMYWMLYVNGESSKVGASDYRVKAGDVIEWRFEDVSNYGK